AWYSRRCENGRRVAMNEVCGPSSTRSQFSRLCRSTVLAKSDSRKPSCMSMSSTAKATPVTATSIRRFWRASCDHAREAGDSMGKRRLGRGRDLDVHDQVGQGAHGVAVVEPDLDLHHADVDPRRGIGAEDVLLADLA